jgi:hypothetical protein
MVARTHLAAIHPAAHSASVYAPSLKSAALLARSSKKLVYWNIISNLQIIIFAQ